MAKPENPTWSDWIQGMTFRAIMRGSKLFSFPTRVRIMSGTTYTILMAVPALRRRISDNLIYIYPQMPIAERKRIQRRVASGLGRYIMETFSQDDLKTQIEGTPIEGPGFETFKEAQAQGQGVIFLTAHFGNWETARIQLKQLGYSVAGVYRPQNNPYFETDFRASLDTHGAPIFSKGKKGMREMLRYLKKGGATVILLDQRDTRGEVLDFMGKPAATPTAAAELALRYGFPMIPLYCTRKDDELSFEIYMEPALSGETATEITQNFNDSLSARVHAHPDQWLWVHRRWKLE